MTNDLSFQFFANTFDKELNEAYLRDNAKAMDFLYWDFKMTMRTNHEFDIMESIEDWNIYLEQYIYDNGL